MKVRVEFTLNVEDNQNLRRLLRVDNSLDARWNLKVLAEDCITDHLEKAGITLLDRPE